VGIESGIIRAVFERSLDRFLEGEVDAILAGVNERNNCGCLGLYLQDRANAANLAGYFADVEYNRKQNGAVKTILNDDYKIITINCDLILHSRGTNIAEDNLIAIEVKKQDRPAEEKAKDRDRFARSPRQATTTYGQRTA